MGLANENVVSFPSCYSVVRNMVWGTESGARIGPKSLFEHTTSRILQLYMWNALRMVGMSEVREDGLRLRYEGLDGFDVFNGACRNEV